LALGTDLRHHYRVCICARDRATVKLSASKGVRTAKVTITGKTFPAHRDGKVLFGNTKVASFTTTAGGAFRLTFTVPRQRRRAPAP